MLLAISALLLVRGPRFFTVVLVMMSRRILALGGLKQKTGSFAPGFLMVLGILNFKTDGNLPYAQERSLWFLACPQRNDPWPQDNGGGSNNRAEGLMVKEPRLEG